MRKILLASLVIILGCREYGNADIGVKLNRSQIDIPKIYKVAVIDTGLDPSLMKKSWVCPTGHKDFTGKGLVDNHGHGTHISGLVDQYAKNFIFKRDGSKLEDIDKVKVNYCQIIIKYYDPKAIGNNNLENTIKSFRWAIDQGVDIINYSGGGTSSDKREEKLIKEALDKGIKIVASAGNEKSDISEQQYFPAMYDERIYIVGSLVSDKVEITVANKVDKNTRAITEIKTTKRDVASYSNYGVPINTWEIGTNVLSRVPGGQFGNMTGTSQAAAIHTGKLIRKQLSNGN